MDSVRDEVAAADPLYPFLSAAPVDITAVLRDIRESTVAKTREIAALREEARLRYRTELVACATAMAERFADGGRLLAFGNNGSSPDVQDMASLFLHPGPDSRALPAFALTSDINVVAALSNDVGFEVVFARQIGAFARENDIAVGLSTSENSENLLQGFIEANRRGLLTVGIAGAVSGRMAESNALDHLFVVPSSSAHRIQEAQTTLYHALWELTLLALERQRC